MSGERGLVISCPIEISKTAIHLRHSNLDPQELRHSLLFWDKLDFPSNNVMHVGLNGDSKFLHEAGVLRRTEIQIPFVSGDLTTSLVSAHVDAFRKLDEAEPGVWSVGGEQTQYPSRQTIWRKTEAFWFHCTVSFRCLTRMFHSRMFSSFD